jgi:hypothetical protein
MLTGVDPRTLLTGVSFVRKHSTTSAEYLRGLMGNRSAGRTDDRDLLIVVDEGTDEEARELADALGSGFTVVADEDGTRARALGVRVWPTTVSFDDPPAVLYNEESS